MELRDRASRRARLADVLARIVTPLGVAMADPGDGQQRAVLPGGTMLAGAPQRGYLGFMRPEDLLQATEFVDSDHPAIRELAASLAGDETSPESVASRLFLHVRDAYVYDPYVIGLGRDDFRASRLIERSRLFCVPKALVFAALCRARGIPAALGFADVRNHLSTPRLVEWLRNDLFVFHGYVALHLGDRWLKASPTFNKELCERFGVATLDFDGRSDALLQPFDREGRRHMEYVTDHGLFADLPFERMRAAWAEAYPHLVDERGRPSASPRDRR